MLDCSGSKLCTVVKSAVLDCFVIFRSGVVHSYIFCLHCNTLLSIVLIN